MKKTNFCDGWEFKHQGSADSELINLPHDAMIHETRDPKAASGSAGAFFLGGVYEYEKTFFVPEDWVEQSVTFRFEGVYKNSAVYINGREMGGCAYGYSQFQVNADDALFYGKDNVIKVIAYNDDQPNSRWYTGSGIYRPVWLFVSGKKHIAIDGVKITTFSYSPAQIGISISHTGGEVAVEILYKGDKVAAAQGDTVTLEIPNAKLWSDETPELYQCNVTLRENGAIVDEATETFGIRLVEWNAQGLFINGENTLLRGGCIHHDSGILGARSYAKSEDRRVRILKAAGFNAVRSAHNPAASALLDACDKYGLYVMDETWDMWYMHKSKYDYASDFMDNYKADLKALVDRDFNHPSVIMYSIGNEVAEPYQEKGVALTKELSAYIHSIDHNRAVTCGVNLWLINQSAKGKGVYKEEGGRGAAAEKQGKMQIASSTLFNMMASAAGTGMTKNANSKDTDKVTSPCLDALDIAGYNYASGRYPLDGRLHPNRIIVGTETFTQDIAKNWAMVKKYPYLIGDFMWTAWDYLGEAGLGAWAYTDDARTFDKPYPWLLNGSGAIDILGNIGAEAEYAATVWGLRDKPWIGVCPVNHPGIKVIKAVWRGTNAIPSWSWKNCEGNKAVVEVYSSASTVDLLLNGKRLGRKRVKNCVAVFQIKYAPGTLTAIAHNAKGEETSRNELQSATGKRSIRLRPEESAVAAGDIAYIGVELVGENGAVECNADTKINLSVEGGTLLAFGSANPHTPESYTSGSFTTYYGKAQAVVRADTTGTLRITAAGDGMETAFASITVLS